MSRLFLFDDFDVFVVRCYCNKILSLKRLRRRCINWVTLCVEKCKIFPELYSRKNHGTTTTAGSFYYVVFLHTRRISRVSLVFVATENASRLQFEA